MATLDLIETGIYSVPEAAKLVGATERQIRGWVAGYKRGEAPVIDNELGWIDNRLAFSFTNLMELRFIAFFVKAGLSLQHIRSIMSEARDLLDKPHPFATSTVFATDGRKIIAKIAKRNGIDLYDLRSHNYEMGKVVYQTLKDGIEYSPRGEIRLWRPRPKTAPHVIVHPKFAFGQPILRESRIPTGTLRDAVEAEGSAIDVADQFDVPVLQVREAVRFERALHMNA
jgi:uncharacterized protein (DUF433 family)/DNA-binding transcriptional MerR regulator